MNNFEWLNTIKQIENRDWHNDNVIHNYDIENYPFYDKTINFRAKVNPQLIKGIQYLDNYNYLCDITWLQLLENLERFDDIRRNMKSFEDIFNHIHFNKKQDKSVAKYGNIYITTDGQHRMALAKFLDISDVEVGVTEYMFNQERYDLYITRIRQNNELIKFQFIGSDEKISIDNFEQRFVSIYINGENCRIDIYTIDDFLKHYKRLKQHRCYTYIKEFIKANILPTFYSRIEIHNSSSVFCYNHLLRLHKLNNAIR